MFFVGIKKFFDKKTHALLSTSKCEMRKQPQPATKKLSFSRNRAPNAQQSLYKQLLYAFGIGAGKTVGNGALPAFGLDDDVGKE